MFAISEIKLIIRMTAELWRNLQMRVASIPAIQRLGT